jgi:hypothetical protein
MAGPAGPLWEDRSIDEDLSTSAKRASSCTGRSAAVEVRRYVRTVLKGTSEIQRLVISRAISGVHIN